MRNADIDCGVLERAAQRFGTPCLCWEQREINGWAKQLNDALPTAAKIIYSVKASPSVAPITAYKRMGFFFETASPGELALLLSRGVDPDKIWVSGQGKTEEYLRYAISNGIRRFNLESPNELKILASLINDSRDWECSLRVNPKYSVGKSSLRCGGASTPFGVDEERLADVLLGEYGTLINGIFLYAGSQFFLAEDIVANTEYGFQLCEKFYSITGRKLKNTDFGGGFGVPENDHTSELDMGVLRHGLDNLFLRFARGPVFSDDASFFFESGRYLAARAACLVTAIVDVKHSYGTDYVITDGGINCLGVKQKEYRLDPPYIQHIGKKGVTKKKFRIVGPTCTPIDLVHPGVMLENPQIGDYIVIPDCGAYSLSFSPQIFNGMVTIPEVLHDNGRLISLAKRGNFSAPHSENEFVPLGTGYEVQEALVVSCPKKSDEVQHLAAAAFSARINGSGFIVYDANPDASEAIFLLKILDKHYGIFPEAVFSDAPNIGRYTDVPCFPLKFFQEWCENRSSLPGLAMLTIGPFADNDISPAMAETLRTGIRNFLKIESEQISGMHHAFCSHYINHPEELQEALNLLEDTASVRCFIEYIRTALENDFWRIEQHPLSAKYWGIEGEGKKPLYRRLEDEVLLNVGCAGGNTIFRFLDGRGKFFHIHAVEADADALRRCQVNLKLLAAGDVLNRISFHNISPGSCGTRIDELFWDAAPTLINMDIEGSENDSLLGAARIIRERHPVLAICAYHRPEDIYVLPRTICSISPDYRFYLRKYPNCSPRRFNSREEIVLYAIPPERLT